MKRLFLIAAMFLAANVCLNAQTLNPWQQVNELEALSFSDENPQIRAHEALYYQIDFEAFYEQLLAGNGSHLMSIPTPDGMKQFLLEENALMSQGLKTNHPGIISFNALPIDEGNTWGKVEISHNGFRAMLFRPGKSNLYVDPVFKESPEVYMAYSREDFIPDEVFSCSLSEYRPDNRSSEAKAGDPYNNCELKTYRLAIAATGEYTIFHGGTVEDALGAMVTTMNRVSGVYERDFGVTFSIIENNDEIVYTDPDTDPYTNGDTFAMINENQANINSVIGAANYDVGHVFGTDSGGLAGLGVICTNNAKARGVTGSGAPVNDPFDIDYVAHELGHQFGANHTQNNDCNDNPATAVEPGSASTIMGYAGICDPNVQNNSDDHFHGASMGEIGDEIELSQNDCPVITDIPNTAPIIEDITETIFIPISTPFALAVNATDLDGDTLTYCWEQMDNEQSPQPPQATSMVGPNFRSFSPSTDSVRYFPRIPSLILNGPYTWERLPSVERQMSFRVSVRDNAVVGGCTQYEDVEVQTVGSAGPFKVLYPNDNGIVWQAFSEETILWDVANTDQAPISAETVDIWLSTNNGFAYQILLADDVPNTGSYTVQVPNVETSIARIQIRNSAGTFFDISDNNFDIISIEDGFYFETDFDGASLCQDETFSFDLNLVEVGNFPDEIALSITSQPDNAVVELSTETATVGETITVTAADLSNASSGVFTLTISGAGQEFENSISFPIDVYNNNPNAPQLQLPENEAESVSTSPILSWQDLEEPETLYNLELATDADFSDIIQVLEGITESSVQVNDLDSDAEYFWRVSSSSPCGESTFSTPFSFSTFLCINESADDTPISISNEAANTISSTIEVEEAALVADINVVGVEGDHELVSELNFKLIGPDGTVVNLASSLCGLSMSLESNGDVVVSSPASIAGSYPSSGAADWSGLIPSGGINANGIQAEDAEDDPNDLCETASNADQLDGNIALINRGNCTFVQKVLFAQQAGALAAIIINNEPGEGFFDMGGNTSAVDIPAVMISYEDGQTILSGLGGDAQNFNLSFDDEAGSNMIPCPPTDGGTYQPEESLSAFNGFNAQGTWTLEIEDAQVGNGGALNSWGLEICFTGDDISNTDNLLANSVSIFPNPTNGLFLVDLGEYEAERAILLDISGRALENQKIQDAFLTFDLGDYADGLYFIRLEGESEQATFKVIKH